MIRLRTAFRAMSFASADSVDIESNFECGVGAYGGNRWTVIWIDYKYFFIVTRKDRPLHRFNYIKIPF